jgi:VWFA-related protein
VWRLVFAGAALVAAVDLAGRAQPAPQSPEPPRFRVGVDAIRLDVVVTDRDGRIVTDLRPDEFELRQDDEVQPISLVRYIPVDSSAPDRVAARPVTGGLTPPSVAPRRLTRAEVQRTMVVVVDDLGIAWENMEPTRRALRRFVDETIQPGDLVGLMRTSVTSGVSQQLTTDKRLLHAAVDQVRWHGFSRREVSSFTPLNAFLPTGQTGFRNPTPASMDMHGIDGLRELTSVGGSLGSLVLAVQAVKELPGRKAVVFVSEGFALGDPEVGDIIRLRLDRVLDQALRGGVVIYSLDPRGLVAGGLAAEDNAKGLDAAATAIEGSRRLRQLLDSQDTLAYMAEETGGLAALNNNDLPRSLRRFADDQRGYYIIGYTPPDGTFAAPGKTPRFHPVEVRVKRPGLKVRTRKGFLGISDPDRTPPPDTPQQALHDAAMSPFAASDIPLRATLVPGYDRKGGASVRALLYIDPRALTFTPDDTGRRVAKADVLGIVFDEWGAPTTGRTAHFTVGLEPDADLGSLEAGIVYSLAVPVPKPGGYQARFAVRDAVSGALGAAGEFVDVPDVKKGRFAISGVVLGEEVRGAATPEVDNATLASVSSPAFRVFEPGARLVYSYEIYNAKTPVETRVVVWRDGEPFFTAPPATVVPPLRTHAATAAGGIRLGDRIPPGDYVFQVTAVTRGPGRVKPKTATRWTSFEVRAQ